MYQGCSSEFVEALNAQSRTFQAKIEVAEKEPVTDLFSVQLKTGSSSEEELKFGSAVAGQVEIEMILPDFFIENQEFSLAFGLEINHAIEYIPVGIFRAEKPEKSKNRIKFVAYDRMVYRAEQAYFSDLTFPSTSLDVLNEICTKINVTLATIDLTSIMIETKPEGYTYREMLGYIAGLYGRFAVFNRNGNLELRWYDTANTYPVDFSRAAEPEVSELDFTLSKITCATEKDAENLVVGNGFGEVTCSNPFMTQTILENIFKNHQGFTYRAGNIQLLLGDPRLDPWDVLSISRDNDDYLIPCMELNTNFDGGIWTEVNSFAKSETEEGYSYKGPSTQALERISTELLLVKNMIASEITVEYLQANYATITDLSAVTAKIDNLTASQITTDYLQSNFATIDLANIEAGCITTAMLGTGVVGTAQIADGSITDAKIVDLTANKLTSGTIDAGIINVVNLNCDNLTVGQINGKQIADGAIDLDKLSSDTSASLVTKTEVLYALSDSATTSPSSAWSVMAPDWIDGMYMWQKTITTYADGSSKESAATCLSGASGKDGEDAVLLRISSSRGTVFKNDSIATILSVAIFYGSNKIIDKEGLTSVFGSSAYLQWSWRRLDEDRFGIIVSSDSRIQNDGFSFVLSADDVDTKIDFQCDLILE